MNTKNIDAATAALAKEVGEEVAREDLAEYVAKLDEVVAAVKAIKEPHKKALRVQQSTEWRTKNRARVAEALALLAEKEAAEAAAAE